MDNSEFAYPVSGFLDPGVAMESVRRYADERRLMTARNNENFLSDSLPGFLLLPDLPVGN